MKTLVRFFHRPVSDESLDNSFALWSCAGGGVGVFVLATVFFSRHAQDWVQLICGLALALVSAVVLFGVGITTTRLQKAVLSRKIPVRARIGEFAGYIAMIGILLGGLIYLPTLPLDRVGMTMGLLLILLASMIPASLGTWSTLRVGLTLERHA